MAKKYRVAICYEDGVTVDVMADNKQDAENKALMLVGEFGGTEYPKEYNANVVHRDYFTQDAELIGEE